MNAPEWPALKALGLPTYLRRAAGIMRQRGLVRGLAYHWESGRVDILGALGLAAGVPKGRLSEGVGAVADAAAPRMRLLVLTAYEALDAFLDADPVEWSDAPERTARQVASALEAVAGLIDAAL